MPAVIRLSIKELKELIEKTEKGQDAIELKKLLTKVEEEERLEKPARRLEKPARRGVPLRVEPGEITTEERLEAEVGGLFPGGITEEILEKCIEMDGKYTLKELRDMCREAGLSPSGAKKELAAKLIAKGVV